MKKLLLKLRSALFRGIFFCAYLPLAVIYRPRIVYTDEAAKQALRSPCIIICNHTSHKDGLLISRLLLKYRVFTFVAKDWYEKPALRPLFSSLNYIPLDRFSFDTQWLDAGLERLKNGNPLLIFPEGRTSKTGVMHPFHYGFLYIAKRAGVPIVKTCLICDYKPFHRQKLIIGSLFERDLNAKGRPSAVLGGYAAECRAELEELIRDNGGPVVLQTEAEKTEAPAAPSQPDNQESVSSAESTPPMAKL